MMADPVKVQRYTRTSRIALPVAAVIIIVAAATVPAWGSSNIMKQGVTFLTLLALAQMWNLLAGYAGLVSVGQQAYVGIGAYSLWVFAEKVGHQPLPLRSHRRRDRRHSSRCPPPGWPSGCTAATSPSAPGSSRRCTACW